MHTSSSTITPTLVPSVQGDLPLALRAVAPESLIGPVEVPLVEIFTAREQRSRTSQGYYRSAIGERLRVVSTLTRPHATGGIVSIVVQRDEATGLETSTELLSAPGEGWIRVSTRVTNTSTSTVVLTAVGSASIRVGDHEALEGLTLSVADSTWLAENRWREHRLSTVLPALDLALHGQDGRGHFAVASHGAWPTGEHLPVGFIVDDASGHALAWQIDSGAGWQMDLSHTRSGAVLSLLGPADLEHQFAHALVPGASFDAAPVAFAVSPEGRDGALAELTRYRRMLRPRAHDEGLPIVYNDFMNTLMGQPSTEALLPLIAGAADAGAEVFCIDAGWFADPAIGDWWATVGEWKEAPTRFSEGLPAVLDEIRRRGMRPGIWLEPEIVGAQSPAARFLPEDAFFQRFGERVREHDRFHLDFRHPAAKAHMDDVMDRLVTECGIDYFKLDYNINVGAGTTYDALGAGDGLLGHARAFRDWLIDVAHRHPGVLIENCSSGAMRADYHLLAVTHIQSTSDQQDFLLYPPIAASAPASILPEQCGNWAYPASTMTIDETAFCLVTGLSGRLYLSGFLDRLDDAQRALVREAVDVHRRERADLARMIPFWPLGLPTWDDDVICLGLRGEERDLLYIWDRGVSAAALLLPGVTGDARQVFPSHGSGWNLSPGDDGFTVRTTPGIGACVIAVTNDPA